MKHIGNALKQIIEGQHMQKNVIARDAGISPTWLSSILRKDTIDCELLERICKAVGISPAYFFDDYEQGAQHIGSVHAQAGIGTATVNISQGEADALRKLLEEKERTIQILMAASGIKDPQKT